MRRKSYICGISAFALAGVWAATASAQQATRLEELVVTAQKREQRLQDVPVSVTALSTESLVANRVTNVRDLDAVVPNLTIRTIVGGNGLPSYTIRGLVSLGSALGADKGVAFYIDGVYIGSANASEFELAEIERIEVLRGPQGTLFGRNSTGGAISMTTPNPTGELGVRSRVTLGNRDQIRTSATINLPTMGPFTALVSLTHSEQRGDIRNLGGGTAWDFTGAYNRPVTLVSSKYLGGSDNNSVAAKVRFQPNDAIDVLYKFDLTKQTMSSAGVGIIYAGPVVRALMAAQTNQALVTPLQGKRPDAVNNAATTPSRTKNYGHSLTATWRANEAITVKNVAAYRYMLWDAPFVDFSGAGGLINTGSPAFIGVLGPALAASTVGAPVVLQTAATTGHDLQWSDEFQVNAETRLATLTAGLYYYEQKSIRGPGGVSSGLGRARSATFGVYPGYAVPFAGQPIRTQGRESTVYTFSRAAYAQGEFHVLPQLDLVGGARYTKDVKKGIDQSLMSGAANPGPIPIYFRKGKWTYNVGANYKPTSDILVYGKYSTGYISGGSLAGIIYNPETAKSLEGGVKADWLDRTLRTNLAVFDVKYSELQVATSGNALTPPQPAVTQALINAGDAKAKGFEFEGTYIPIRQVSLNTGIGYTDFKYTRIDPRVITGNQSYMIANRPKWTWSLSGQFTSDPVFQDAYLVLRADAAWKSKSNGSSAVPLTNATFTAAEQAAFVAAQRIPAYWLVNARAAMQGIKLGTADATLALWARNLFNDRSKSYTPAIGNFFIAANFEAARSFGVDFDLSF
jgi:iron complex outermembrane receptor protein